MTTDPPLPPPPPRRRRWLRLAAFALALAAAALAPVGCTSTVHPPAHPVDPVTVFLAHDARHIGLLLPRGNGTLVEYGYGDWEWYAMEHDAWYNVFATVLWPTQGTLARCETTAVDDASLRRSYPWIEYTSIAVPRDKAQALLASLDAAFERHRDQLHHSDHYAMDFVPHDDGYWFAYNCNDAVAVWLRQLDCTVSWVPIRLGLQVR